MSSQIQATIPKFPVAAISREYLRSLRQHSARDCTYEYVVEHAQFYMGPVNQLLPCVLVGHSIYWRDAAVGGREQVTRYFFRMAGITSRLDGLGDVEKVYMNDSSEDAMLETAYVRRDPVVVPSEFVEAWLAIDKATRAITSLRYADDPSREYFVANPSDYHVVDIKFEVPVK